MGLRNKRKKTKAEVFDEGFCFCYRGNTQKPFGFAFSPPRCLAQGGTQSPPSRRGDKRAPLCFGAGGRTRIERVSDDNASTRTATMPFLFAKSRNLLKIEQIPAMFSPILQPHGALLFYESTRATISKPSSVSLILKSRGRSLGLTLVLCRIRYRSPSKPSKIMPCPPSSS